MANQLGRAREAYRRREWDEAYRGFALADRSAPLAVDDLERFATSAYLIGRDREFQDLMERAHHAHLLSGHRTRAARCAFWVGLTLLLGREAGPAGGWLARARRLVEGQDCAEQGYLLVPLAEQRLAEGDAESGRSTAARAAEIGDRFGDDDLATCARHIHGRALIRQGEMQAGLALLDEAMVAVVAGELSPIMTGLIYCSVIEHCQEVFALSRAREWTTALARWCEQQPRMVAFTGSCLVHRAEILQFGGNWPDALAEAARACRRHAEEAMPRPPPMAFYRCGEIHRLRGEFAQAEDAYRASARLGGDPQPGLSLLRLAQGRTDAARAAIRRVLSGIADPLQRARMLPAQIDILLAAGELDEARAACIELADIADSQGTDMLQALAAQAQGEVSLADGEAATALVDLRRAFALWRQLGAPYESARVRVRIGLACRMLGDAEAAALELDAARAEFERLGAAPDLARLEALVEPAARHAGRLTSRELEVLRLIAAGKTNKAIAAQLHLSERTVDRHVSNIFTKLDVPSRAAATAYAYDHGLF